MTPTRETLRTIDMTLVQSFLALAKTHDLTIEQLLTRLFAVTCLIAQNGVLESPENIRRYLHSGLDEAFTHYAQEQRLDAPTH